jgi:hypothetical protein
MFPKTMERGEANGGKAARDGAMVVNGHYWLL